MAPPRRESAPLARVRRAVAVLGFLACALNAMNRSTLPIAIIPMANETGWSPPTQGLVLSSVALPYAIMQVPSGVLAYRAGSGRTQILAGMVIASGLLLATPFVISAVQRAELKSVFGMPASAAVACSLQFAQGATSALLNPALHWLIASWSKGDAIVSSSMHGVVYSGQTGGAVVGIVVAGSVSYAYGWRWAYGVASLSTAVAAALFALLLHDTPARARAVARVAVASRLKPSGASLTAARESVEYGVLDDAASEGRRQAGDADDADDVDDRAATRGCCGLGRAWASLRAVALSMVTCTSLADVSAMPDVAAPVAKVSASCNGMTNSTATASDPPPERLYANHNGSAASGYVSLRAGQLTLSTPLTQVLGDHESADGTDRAALAGHDSNSHKGKVPGARGNADTATAGLAGGVKALCALPWARIWQSQPWLALVLNHFCFDWGSYTYSRWGPSYLDKQLGVKLKDLGFVAMVPNLLMFFVVLTSGWGASWLLANSGISVTRLRKLYQGVGMIGPAVLLLVLAYGPHEDATMIMALLFGSVAVSGLCLSGHHINHIDLSPKYASILYGIDNTVANISGVVAPAVAGWILGDHPTPSAWKDVFAISAAIQAGAGLVWIMWASGEPQRYERE